MTQTRQAPPGATEPVPTTGGSAHAEEGRQKDSFQRDVATAAPEAGSRSRMGSPPPAPLLERWDTPGALFRCLRCGLVAGADHFDLPGWCWEYADALNERLKGER